MSKGLSGHFSGTKGAKKFNMQLQLHSKQDIVSGKGHITVSRIRQNQRFWHTTNVQKIEKYLRNHGYEFEKRASKRRGSNAVVIVITNQSKDRNISQIQISPGSGRHGLLSYVKISTTDYGRIKVVNGSKNNYKSDGTESATIIYKREREK